MNGVGFVISRRRFSFGTNPVPGLAAQEPLCNRVLLKCEKGQTKLLTSTSEGGQGTLLASLSKGARFFLNWLLQYIERMSQGCKDLTRPTATVYILR